MGQKIEILIQYTQADFIKRMYLFLQFPDLRNAFQKIERKDLAAQRASLSSTKQHNKRKCSWLLSFFSRIIEMKILRNSELIGKAEICSMLGNRKILKWGPSAD